MHISEEIGKKINIFRKKKGWTVQELGDAIGKSKIIMRRQHKVFTVLKSLFCPLEKTMVFFMNSY